MEYTPSKENNQENDIINNNIEQNNLFNNSPLKLYCSDISEIDKQNENGWTPIYRSIIANNLNVLSDLLKLGANPNLQNNIGETPLYLCVDIDNYEAIIILLQKNADCNISKKDGTTPLHLATKKNKEKFIKILLEYGANPNLKNKLYSQTAMHLAIKNKLGKDFLLLFKKNNADCFEIKDKYEKSPFDYAKELNDEDYLNMVKNIFEIKDINNEEKENYDNKDENENKVMNLNSLFKNIELNMNNNIDNDYNDNNDAKNNDNKNNDINNINDIQDKDNIIINKENEDIKRDVETKEDKKDINDNILGNNKDILKENINININKKSEENEIIIENKEKKIYKPKKSIKRKIIKDKGNKINSKKINKNILKKELIREEFSQKEISTAKGKENNLGLGITLSSSDNDIYKSNTVKNMPIFINEQKLSTLSENELLKNIIIDTAKKIRNHNIYNTSSNISLDNKDNNINTLKSEKEKNNLKELFSKTFENGLSNNNKKDNEINKEMNTMNPLDMMNQIITTNSIISNDIQDQLNNKYNNNKDSDLLEYSKSNVTNGTHLNNIKENNLNKTDNNINNSSSKKNDFNKKISYHCGKYLHKNNNNLKKNFNELDKKGLNEENIFYNEEENINDDESFDNNDNNENINNENNNSLKYKNLNVNNKQYMHSTYDNSKYSSILDNSNYNNKQISINSQINSINEYKEKKDMINSYNSNSYKEKISRNKLLKLNNSNRKIIANSISNTTYNSNINNSSSKKYAKKLAILTELENSKNNSINQPMKTSISNIDDNDSIMRLGSGHNIIPNDLSSKLHDWLMSCDLLCYYNLLIKNQLFDINQYINDIKSNKKIISYKSVEDLGIKKPGHIYRFLLKIKLDSNMLDPYIYNSIIDKYNRSSLNDIKISMSNSGYRLGCCCFRDSNLKLEKRSINSGLEFSENTNDIFAFLKKMDLLRFKENFIHNGFDQVEFIMIQLFSEYKFNKDILNDCLHIYSEEDKLKVISKLYNEKTNLCQEYNIKYEQIEDKDIYDNYLKNYNDRNENHGICFIF